jgi:hypothetical protein
MRRGRDERTGEGAALEGDNQYVSFMAGEQTEEGNDVEESAEVESAFHEIDGAAVSEGEDYDTQLHNEDGDNSFNLVEGASLSENPDPAAADVHESAIRANPEPDEPAWVHGGDLYDDEHVNTSGESSADAVEGGGESDGSEDAESSDEVDGESEDASDEVAADASAGESSEDKSSKSKSKG